MIRLRERESERVRSHGEAVGNRNCQRHLLQAKILDLMLSFNSQVTTRNARPSLVWPTPRNACLSLATAHSHTMLAFHWPRHTPTWGLSFVCHSPLSCDACLSLTTAHTNMMLVFRWPHPLPRNAYLSLATDLTLATLNFHWPRPTPTWYLPFTGHSLHPCNVYFQNHFVVCQQVKVIIYTSFQLQNAIFPQSNFYF